MSVNTNEITLSEASVAVGANPSSPRKRRAAKRSKKQFRFFCCMIAVPVAIFILFYVVVNFNYITMAFKTYTPKGNGEIGYDVSFAGFDNFAVVIQMLSYEDNWRMVANSVLLWALKLCIGLPFSFLFSYYIYKKMPGSKFFRIILFLPNVVSNLIMVYLFRYFANDGVKLIFGLEQGLLQNPKTELWTVIFFNLWLGFASQTLIFTSAMSGINESTVEAAQIDGASYWQEMWHITLPSVFKTFTTFVVLGIAEMFVDQMSLVTFYDKFSSLPRMWTVGYYLFVQAYSSELVPSTLWTDNPASGRLTYAQLAAFGLMISVIIVPLSIGVKKLMEKYGPSED